MKSSHLPFHGVRLSKWCSGIPLLVLVMGLAQTACQNQRKVESVNPVDESDTQANLLTVSQDQFPHLQVVPVREAAWSTTVRTTGTVDWDADHTTQAITQVNGPISRILVDTGKKVAANQPLLYVASPDVANAISAYRKAQNREALSQTHRRPDEQFARSRGGGCEGRREQPRRIITTP